MMRSIFILMYCLFWLWVALGLFISGDILSSGLNLLLGVFLYFVIFTGIWKKNKETKKEAASHSSYSSDSNSFWDLFISDSASDSSSSDGGGGDGGGGGGGD
jgi:uncharacterized membrane protein YfcA